MPPLTPILLRLLHGRVGSTLLMQLLTTSDEVVCDRIMPYEHRYLAYLVELTRPQHIPWSSPPSPAEPIVGNRVFCVDLDEFARQSLANLWQSFSDVARARHPSVTPRYYAEKSLGTFDPLIEASIPFRIIDVVRDPRDVYVSACLFSQRLGRDAFGLRLNQPDSVNVPLFLCDIAWRLAEMGTTVGGVEPLIVHYEEMVNDLPGVADALGRALGLQFDPDRVVVHAADNGSHMTAQSVSASVGRWRTELNPEIAALMTRMLAEPMERLGYAL